MDLALPIHLGNRRSDSEQRFQKIIEKSGTLKINEQIYRSTLNDMQDLGELGSGTSGHVVKMRHRPSGAIIAVKVGIFCISHIYYIYREFFYSKCVVPETMRKINE